MKAQQTRKARLQASLIGVLGWLLPLGVALASGYWLATHGTTDDIRQNARARDDIRAMSAALLSPRNDGKGMPNSEQGLQSLIADGILPNIPDDPWGRPYQYRNPGATHAWELYSFGPDGRESADDIVSWNLYGGR